MFRKFLYILLLLLSGLVRGQDYQSRIYQAYLQKQMGTWKEVMEEMDLVYRENPDLEMLYDLIEAEYGYTAYCISVKRRKEAREVLDRAMEHICLFMELEVDNPRIYSLQGAFFGFRFFLEPLRALQNRNHALEANQKAIDLGPNEPQAWMGKANIDFYTPAILGGSKRRAVLLYEKAVRLYESSPDRIQQNWVYLNCLAGLGMAYEKTGQIKGAGAVYRKLLKLEPSFLWVRDDLYPQFQEKHSMN